MVSVNRCQQLLSNILSETVCNVVIFLVAELDRLGGGLQMQIRALDSSYSRPEKVGTIS